MKQKSAFAAVTIASRNFIANARTTARSFAEHNPGLDFYVLLADREDACVNRKTEPWPLLPVEQLGVPDLQKMCFHYGELELSYALTPHAIRHVLDMGYRGVIFLKQETLVLGELASTAQTLERFSALVTPHFMRPTRRADALTWEINVLRSGVFNGGFVAFADCPQAHEFLRWWEGRTHAHCYLDVERGVHYEQRWLDFLPSLMPGCHVLRNPGINIGHWNLPDRDITVREGRFYSDGEPCRVFRFSGYDPSRPELVTRYNEGYRVENTGSAAQIFRIYQQMLEQADHDRAQRLPYAWGHFDNGDPIEPYARRLYREMGAATDRFGNPFAAGTPSCFHRWLGRQPRTLS